MAVTITQKPTTPNVAYSKLVYEVSGSGTTSNPQYNYVLDIYESGSNDRITRLLTQPNSEGVAEFNIAQIIQGQLEYPSHDTVSGRIYPTGSFKEFKIAVSESYGTSISSSVEVYAGGDEDNIQVFPGTVDSNIGSFNWPDYTTNSFLTNKPTYTKYSRKDVLSIDLYTSGAFNDSVNVSYRRANGSLVGGISFGNSESNPTIQTLYFGSGSTGNLSFQRDDVVQIEVSCTGLDSVFYLREECPEEGVTFSFVNKYGFTDHYSVYNPVRRVTQVDQNTITLPKVNYSNTISTYSIESGGETSYYTDTTDTFSITTDPLDQANANWVEELIESPDVYIQQNGKFVPIIITNSSYTSDTNENRQKLFQYTIEFKASKGREVYKSLEQLPNIPIPERPVLTTGSLEFRTTQVALMCVNTQFTSLTSSQEIVQSIEYGMVPQRSYQSGDYYFYEHEGVQVGTALRDSAGNIETSLNGYIVYGLEVVPANTLNRLKEKMWSISSGSLLNISSGYITSIDDMTTIVDTLPLPVNVPVTNFTGSFKVTQDYAGYSGYDMSLKSRYNFNAYASFGASGYANYNTDGTVDILNYGPGPSVGFEYRRYVYRHTVQNAPFASKSRRLGPYTGYTQCVSTQYGDSFDVVEFPGRSTDPGFANENQLHWVWRGYQYPSDYEAPYEPPTVYKTYQEACAYTGSFTNTLFVSGTLEPGKEIFQAPNVTTTGVGQGAGFRTTRGTGSNDYFPILTPDGVRAVLYANPADVPSSEILEIKNADGTDYTGSAIYRWEGPYFWRSVLEGYTDASNKGYTDCTTSVFIEPFRSLEFVNVGDTVYTSYDLQNNTYSSPLNGGNNWVKLHDESPNVSGRIGRAASLNYVYQIDTNGVIVDRILSGSI